MMDDTDDIQFVSSYRPKQANATLARGLLGAQHGITPRNTTTPTSSTTNNPTADHNKPPTSNQPLTLLQQHIISAHQEEDGEEQQRLYEERIMQQVIAQGNSLQTRGEAAGKDRAIYEPIETGWSPPDILKQQPPRYHNEVRERHNIAVDGQNIPPPIETWKMMRIPKPIADCLQSQGITAPRAIQMQGCTVALSGRDMIGIAQTGGGKTLVFALPLVTLALREEIREPYRRKQGPFGLVLVPQRELAEQIHQFVDTMCLAVQKAEMGIITPILAIGGISMADQWSRLEQDRGFHILVGTPGKVKDLVQNKKIFLDRCKLFCLDEADRLVAENFQDDLRTILEGFTRSKQTILFSATMPVSVKALAKQALHNPITITVGQAGTANKDIRQDVIWMPEEKKFYNLLKVIQRTPPPTLVFCNSHSTVDLVYEYLRVKGVEAGCIHSALDQTNRSQTVEEFKNGDLDVLVATDLLAKGIDFGADRPIHHVINFDMPDETQFYVHRIGRTGRGGNKGVATTFVNDKTKQQILLDLKHLLLDAEQVVPEELAAIHDPFKNMMQDPATFQKGVICKNCGGLGHSIAYCPELLKKQFKPQRGKIDTINRNDA